MSDLPKINRRVELAYNMPLEKWFVRLECGHEYVCDHSVTRPGMVMACEKCESGTCDHPGLGPDNLNPMR